MGIPTDGRHRGPHDPRPSRAPFQYGVRYGSPVNGRTDRALRRQDAETLARDWAISPLRTGPRQAHLVRRRGYTGAWEILATWSSPEWSR